MTAAQIAIGDVVRWRGEAVKVVSVGDGWVKISRRAGLRWVRPSELEAA